MVGDYLSYFNLPTWNAASGKVTASYTIQNKLLEYIDGAAPGSAIRGHITTISLSAITDALIRARDRGVAVYLVQHGQQWDRDKDNNLIRYSPEGDRLELAFGTQHKYCSQYRVENLFSCVSSVPGATHHIKNWLFSDTWVGGIRRRYSSWVTSYNLTETSNKQFNDVFIVNDNYELYSAYVRSFAHFYGQRRTDDFFSVPGRGYHFIPSANTEISYSPHKKSGSNAASDHVAVALSRIDRFESGCTLQVAMLSISAKRSAVIDQLKRIKALGCRVMVAYTSSYGFAAFHLLNAGIEVRIARAPEIHSKMMVYKGWYEGQRGRTLVWGGSHNWNTASLRVNDEVFVGISRLGIYERYKAYFNTIWARSAPLF